MGCGSCVLAIGNLLLTRCVFIKEWKPFVITVEYNKARLPGKEFTFGGGIALHRLVVVEVILGEIGHDCNVNWHTIKLMLIKRVAGNL